MNKHVFSIFMAVVFASSACVYAQIDGSDVTSAPVNVVPLLPVLEDIDGMDSEILEATPPEKLSVPPLNDAGMPMSVGDPIGELVMMTEVDGNIEDDFTMQVGDEMFVWNSGIADEMNLTPAQRDTIQYSVQVMFPQGHSGGGRLTRVEDARQRIVELRETINQALDVEQRMMFATISFQLAGGLNSPSLNNQMLEHLGLTPAQKEQLNAITSAREAEIVSSRRQFNFIRATPAEREAFDAANVERTKKYAEQIKAILTPEQKTKAEKLTADIPALREKLGMPLEGLAVSRTEQRTQRQQQDTPAYTPGPDAWRPGQPLPLMISPHHSEERRRFPRGEN
jgi:Spy/CpxP family protein refolding chaperone